MAPDVLTKLALMKVQIEGMNKLNEAAKLLG
jgi:hypothetical protein